MDITRKQYYSRLYNLIHCGLIKRKERKYFLTALGRVMFDSQITIENAIRNYWKIKAMDSIRITRDSIGRAVENHRDHNANSRNQQCN